MQLVPVLSYPTLRIKPESNICELIQDEVGQLNVRVRLPENYKANHLILMFKLKDGKRHVGPNLLLCAKIINRKVVEEEVSAFAMENDLDNVRGQGGLQNQLKMIKRGIDVYTEQQLLNMGSIAADEGFGSFDRCMLLLRTLRGDIDKARKILSRIMVAESQLP